MLNAAIVGLGWWGRQIVTSVRGSERIRISTAVDPATDHVAAFAERHGLALVADYAAALADPALDAVILATPHGLHEDQVLAAVAAGKQVFCEKPLALSADAARRMVKACQDAGLILGIGHERRFEPGLEELARKVTDGEIGTLAYIEINWSHNLFAGNTPSGWRQDASQAPAGTMTALGVHMTDYMQTFAGPVAYVTAHMADRSPSYPGNDVIAIHLEFESGVPASLCSIATTPFYQRISAFGDTGWVELRETTNVDDPAPAVLTWRTADMEIFTRTYAQVNSVGTNIDAWAAAVAGERSYRFTDPQKVHNVEILEAVVKSARDGTRIRVG